LAERAKLGLKRCAFVEPLDKRRGSRLRNLWSRALPLHYPAECVACYLLAGLVCSEQQHVLACRSRAQQEARGEGCLISSSYL